MARSFNGTSDGLTGSAPTTSSTLTMAGRFWIDSTGTTQVLCSLGVVGSANNRRDLINNSTGPNFQARSTSNTGSNAAASSSSSGLGGAWVHVAGVWAGTNNRKVGVNGTLSVAQTTNITHNNPDQFRIGLTHTGSAFLAGRAAEVGIWDAALTADEVAMLSDGVSPLLVHPQNLLAYWQIVGRTNPEIDIVGGFNLSQTGSMPSVIEHPLVRYAARRFVVKSTGGIVAPIPRRAVLLEQAVNRAGTY